MLEILILISVAVVAFAAGAVYGALQKATVDDAIATVKAAEASAVATLAKITAHKAG